MRQAFQHRAKERQAIVESVLWSSRFDRISWSGLDFTADLQERGGIMGLRR